MSETEYTYFATDVNDNPIMLSDGDKCCLMFKGKMQVVTQFKSKEDLLAALEAEQIDFPKIWEVEFSYRTYESHYGTTETSNESLYISQVEAA